MTSKNNKDWIDEVLEDEPCSSVQISIIESLLVTSSAVSEYKNIKIEKLNNEEAIEIIRDLRNNNTTRDCKEQFNQMFKRGVFE
tara:strand:- start:74 stop:325 length:252 start_codon:yes stop_codon:yes gene_type:complete